GFASFLWLAAKMVPPGEFTLYSVVGLLMAAGTIVAFRRMLSPWGAVMAWVSLISSGLFLSYSSVVIRQGLAVTCLFVAVSYVVRGERSLWLWLALAAAASLHWSAIPFSLALLLLTVKNVPIKTAVLAWLAGVVGFMLGVQELVVGGVIPYIPKADYYLSSLAYEQYGSAGNRMKFMLVGAAVGVVGLIGLKVVANDAIYGRLLVVFLIFNTFYLALGFVAYSDRLASYSWFLAPLLVWYPLDRRFEHRWVATATASALAVLVGGFAMGPFG
ncbi:EpsG family protein, partial [Terrabacter terrae]